MLNNSMDLDKKKKLEELRKRLQSMPEKDFKELLNTSDDKAQKYWDAAERMRSGPAREAAKSEEVREKARLSIIKAKKGQGNERLSTPEVRAKAHATRKANNNYDISAMQTPEAREKARLKMKETKKGIAPAHNFSREWQEKKYRKVNQLTLDGKLIKTWDGIAQAADTLGIKRPGITSVCSDKPQYAYCKTYKGYKWEYAD